MRRRWGKKARNARNEEVLGSLPKRGGGDRDGDDSTSRIFFFSLVREQSGYHDDINDLVR